MSKPATTLEFLDALKARKGFTSDYQLWKSLGWKQATVSKYRVGKSTLSRPHALRIADELGLPREYVLACVELEREHEDAVRGVWRSIAQRFAASIIVAAGLVWTHTPDAHAAAGSYDARLARELNCPGYTLCELRYGAGRNGRRLRALIAAGKRWLSTVFPAVDPSTILARPARA